MPRALAALAFAALLALPIGLTTALVSDALLRVGVWLDGPFARVATGGGRERVEAALAGADPRASAYPDAWRAAAAAALARPLPVRTPYAETLFPGLDGSPADDPTLGARAFEVSLAAPDVLRVASLAADGATGGLLVDVFDPLDVDAAGAPRTIASLGPADVDVRVQAGGAIRSTGVASGASAGSAPAPATRTLHVRVQPTPGATGRFALLLETRPALDFPVATDAESPVRSFFGMPRDGGARQHHGIDVFAPRGTPVLAAADGIVVRTGDSARGGLHVWQRAVDDAGAAIGALYYAHLDRVDVTPGTRVTRGDRLGTVGNTGNARTTPPHLHFGLYRRFAGPEGPLPLTGSRRAAATSLEAAGALPRWLAVRSAKANLRAGPGTGNPVVGSLEAGDLVRVDALVAGGDWLRVGTGTDPIAWIARSLVGAPVANDAGTPPAPFELRVAPSSGSAVLARVDGGARVLGRFGAATRVSTSDGLVGWTGGKTSP